MYRSRMGREVTELRRDGAEIGDGGPWDRDGTKSACHGQATGEPEWDSLRGDAGGELIEGLGSCDSELSGLHDGDGDDRLVVQRHCIAGEDGNGCHAVKGTTMPGVDYCRGLTRPLSEVGEAYARRIYAEDMNLNSPLAEVGAAE